MTKDGGQKSRDTIPLSKYIHISQLSFEYLRETGIEPDSPASVRCATHSQPSIHRSHHVRNVHAWIIM
jgi:recombinational DNA repair protein (RecF pathway)